VNAIQAVLFDKDGTLFDFMATWGAWTRNLIADLAAGSGQDADRLARAVGYDLSGGTFEPDSPVIAHTPEEIAAALLPYLPGASPVSLVGRMNALASVATLTPAAPLVPLLGQLKARGLKLGLATNDAEVPALAHLAQAGIADFFDFVAGWDSGYGAKPGTGQMLAFVERTGVVPGRVVMVGDSRHDLIAGRAAGMRTVGVLTGPARAEDLAPLADAVLPDIGHLPRWLDRNTGEVARV
jgi:phosphoglycolate phosphatase